MPTYEYECQKCGHRFEQFQNMKDKPLKTCPTCGGSVRRLLGTGAALVFKKALASTAPIYPCKEELKEVCCA